MKTKDQILDEIFASKEWKAIEKNDEKAILLFQKLKGKKSIKNNPCLKEIQKLGYYVGIDFGKGQCYCELLVTPEPYDKSHHLDSFPITMKAGNKEGLYIFKEIIN